jgi:hypothetical protein
MAAYKAGVVVVINPLCGSLPRVPVAAPSSMFLLRTCSVQAFPIAIVWARRI